MGADILKQELGTTSNSLSFWKCDNLEKLKDTIKAILLSTTGIKASTFFILSDDIIDKYGFKMDDTQPGLTGYKGFEQLHINMTELTYSKIGTVLQISVRNRKIAAKINTENENLKDDFADLLNSNDHDTRLWVAHHILEIMTYDKAIRIKALEVIKEESKNGKDEVSRFGHEIWLQNYYNAHPEDATELFR